MSSSVASAPPPAGKPAKIRLPILDGLRGVAALIVVAFHIFDTETVNPVNHGYLAVDFFFMLSGYVMGYAYDDRWGTMSLVSFFKRRLVRLHPMVVIGSIIGAVFFYFGACELFGLVDRTSFGMLVFSTVLGALMIPSVKSMDVRGWGENYPLNGPQWSLFYEYIANVAYALWIRRWSVRALGVASVVFAGLLTWVIVTAENGTVSFGWVLPDHFWNASVRLFFPFLAGLFLFRLGRTITMKHAFAVTSVALLVLFAMPRIGPAAKPWVNGIYECVVIIALLPVVVLIGAGSRPATRFGEKLCDFLGELSYPLYLVHYPVCYAFFGLLNRNKTTATENLPLGIAIYAGCLALGYVVMRFVDAPIRRKLAKFAK